MPYQYESDKRYLELKLAFYLDFIRRNFFLIRSSRFKIVQRVKSWYRANINAK